MSYPFAEYPSAAQWQPQRLRWQPGQLIAGVDEVGRGPLVGAVVTAAVILDPQQPIEGLDDSKKLSEKKRRQLAEIIKQRALAYAFGRAEAAEIDTLNILHATLLAMQRAVAALPVAPHLVLVDGHQCPNFAVPAEAVVKGDGTVPAISAASILAKVARDDEMYALHEAHPDYGFDRHKGYPTKAHLSALATHGALPEHRRSFAPVARVLQEKE